MTVQEEIQERINGRLNIDANLLEGGFSQDIIGSVSYELANVKETEIDTLLDKAFVSTAKGEYLDRCGEDYGINRRLESNSIVNLTITGIAGAIVSEEIKAVYNNLVFQVTEYAQIPQSGTITVKAKCLTAGSVGNVSANTITQFLVSYEGLTTVNNPQSAYDGFDKEDDETYRTRIKLYLAEDASNANKAQYKQWALSVAGVQKAVVESAETAGAGNVAVHISSTSGTVSQDLIDNVKNYIESVQPINATIIVNALVDFAINVSAVIVLKTGYTKHDVETELTESLAQYLATVDEIVSYFKISELLFNCSGVEDVTSYTLNGSTSSITLTDTQQAVVGTVTIDT